MRRVEELESLEEEALERERNVKFAIFLSENERVRRLELIDEANTTDVNERARVLANVSDVLNQEQQRRTQDAEQVCFHAFVTMLIR